MRAADAVPLLVRDMTGLMEMLRLNRAEVKARPLLVQYGFHVCELPKHPSKELAALTAGTEPRTRYPSPAELM